MTSVRTVLVALVMMAGAAVAQPRVTLRPCEVSGISARCGTVDVFENRARRSGRKISLNVVVVPALGSTHAPDAVFWLEGGPGGAATLAIGPVAQQYFKGIRDDHDLVFVDQRGTGQSNPLKCDDIGETPANIDAYFGALFPIERIRACRHKLEAVADLTQYTTAIAADDLDDVRAALGYTSVDLAGASYGTLTAQAYLRQHGSRVRAAFLVGTVTPGFRLPLPFAKASENAFGRMVADCVADDACQSAFPRLKSEFAAVLARFSSGPLAVQMVDPSTGQPRMVTLARENYVEHIRALLYSTGGARFVPLVVHQAFLNDYTAFQTMATRYNLGGPNTSRGMYFSVTCAESAPFISEAEIAAETRGTFLGDRRLRAHLAACAEWPRGSVDRRFLEPVRSTVPVVMFAGDADGSTPPWFAADAARSLPHARVINAPHTGHQIDGPCTWNLMQAFIRNPSVTELDAACVERAHRPPFATELPK